jgi:hypothetical protein
MKLPAERLGEVLGITHVNYLAVNHSLAVVDSTLAMTSRTRIENTAEATEVKIDNFSFAPPRP